MRCRLEVESLTVRMGQQILVADLSFSAAPGEVIGLVGASGSGKSMTALALAGLLPSGASSAGTIRLDDETVHSDSLRKMRGRQLGLIFQEPATALNPLMRIGDQVAEAILIHEPMSRTEASRRASVTLARVGLDPADVGADRFPHELSGGQRQRVAIAIAIAAKPSVLIADEPTTALDVTTQAQILDLLRDLTRLDGMTTLLISHDLAVVAHVASRILVMNRGCLVESGDTHLLLASPSHPETRRLVSNYHAPQTSAALRQGPPLLVARNLSRWYRQRHREKSALRKISLTVRAGERVGIIGESGSGKSTLVRTLLGLELPQEGSVEMSGAQINPRHTGQLTQQRRAMQAVFQDPVSSLNPRLSIEKIVGEPLHLLSRQELGNFRTQRIKEALESVGLGSINLQARPHEFSGGQRQRIALARALIVRPQLLVLDEAVSALDTATRNDMISLLLQLWQDQGLALLFVTHDLSIIRAITDRVLVLRDGEVVEEGATESLLNGPQHPYTRQLIASTPTLVAHQ